MDSTLKILVHGMVPESTTINVPAWYSNQSKLVNISGVISANH